MTVATSGANVSRVFFIVIVIVAIPFAWQDTTSLVAQVASDVRQKTKQGTKGQRYNGGPCDLTINDDCGFEHFAPPALQLIPFKESTFVILGRVTKVEPNLSADRTHIYIETRICVQEVFKSPAAFSLPLDRTLIVDQIGGSMRTASGRIIRDGSVIDFIGKAYVGGYYVFFLHEVHEGEDLAILSAYELRGGKVYRLKEDGSAGTVLLSGSVDQTETVFDELRLLQALRLR